MKTIKNKSESELLKLANEIMNCKYETLDEAIFDMHDAIDYGIEHEDEVLNFLKECDNQKL